MKRLGFGWAVFALAIVVYLGTLGRFFVSDDFLNMERNIVLTLADLLSLFSTTDVDFFRPIPRLHFGLLQGFVGDRAIVWNAVGLLLHGLASVLVYQLAREFLGKSREVAARWTGVLFAVHFIHVEPVLWASGVTTTYVTVFVIAALRLHRRSRRTGRARDLVLAVLAFQAALLSKETAIAFVPLWLLTLRVWPVTDRKGREFPRSPTVAEALPFAVVLGAYLLVVLGIDRGGDASPYRMMPGPHVLKNALFFLLGGFVPLRYWEVQELWARSAGLGEFVSQVVARPLMIGPLAVGGVAVAAAMVRGGREVRNGFLWIGAASLPFLLLPGSGERFLYLASFGACLVLGLGIQAAAAMRRVGSQRFLVGALVASLFVVGNLDRQRDWDLAGRWTRSLTGRGEYFLIRPESERIEFQGVLDSYRSAWVFRNGFDSMVRLYWEGRQYWRAEEAPPGETPDAVMGIRMGENGGVVVAPGGFFGTEPGVQGPSLPPSGVGGP